MQRSTSFNNNMRIPRSPMSFASNNINTPGSSVLDGSPTVQTLPQIQQQQQEGASSVTSLPIQQMGQAPICMVSNDIGHVNKKPRIEAKQEDVFQHQQILQQLLQRQDPMSHNPQLQVLLQQRLRQQQQLLQSMTPSQRLQLQQQQQQQQQQHQQLRQQLQQQGIQQIPPTVRQYEGGVCVRRLMMYLYHQQQRPQENNISYWRKFVAEYYSPRAKQRLCLSRYGNTGNLALGMFPPGALDMWHCDLCCAKSGKGFEVTFEALARLIEVKFDSGIIDELLYLDYPCEKRYPSGLMLLEYKKAVQESIHEQFRVVREGHLRIIFAQDLKILVWEFCVRRHEELIPRRLIAPKVNEFLQVVQKCQSTILGSGSQCASQQDLQSNSNMAQATGRQLAKYMELQSLDELGYPKRYIRTLQISEVVRSMKDLMDITKEQQIGPNEGLKRLSERAAAAKLQRQKMQGMEQLATPTPNGQMALPSVNHSINNTTATATTSTTNNQMVGRGALSGSAQAALALTNYQRMLMRQNSVNNTKPNPNAAQQDPLPSTSFSNPNLNPSSLALQRQDLPVSGFSSHHLSPQVQQLQHPQPQPQPQPQQRLQPQLQPQQSKNATSKLLQHHHHHHPQWSQGNNNHHQALPQNQMIQQLIQEISNNNGGRIQQQSFSGQINSNNGNAERNATPSTSNTSGGGGGAVPNGNNSFKATSNSYTTTTTMTQRAVDLPQNFDLAEDISVPELPHDFTDDGFFNSDDLYGL